MCCLGLIQFWQVFKKNFVIGWRSRELIYEVLLPLLTGVLMVVKNVIFPIQFLAPIIVALAINTCSRSLLIRLVEEKNSRYKEVQKIMGLSSSAYFLAWYLSALIRIFISAGVFIVLPLTVVSKVDVDEQSLNILDMSDYLGFWDILYGKKEVEFLIAYGLYAVAATNQAFAISTIFSNPKLAGEFSTFLTTLSSLLSFLVFSPTFIETPFYFIAVSLSPQACIAFAYIGCVKNPIYHENFELANNPYTYQYPIDVALTQMITLIVFYLIVYIYLEAVTPNEYGIAMHPFIFPSLKCCQKRKNKKDNVQIDELEDKDIEENKENNNEDQMNEGQKKKIPIVYDTSSAIYHQPFENIRNGEQTVEIQGLVKEFGNFRAVNEISLKLYNKNIFCLLGHNGSGKTTTISLLTGLIEKSQGQIKYFGQELESNLKSIRKSLGICAQKEVLYEEMTFEEHLHFIGRIKGISRKNMKDEIEKVIKMTKTEKERKKKSKQLSGGNKRKLSLCMALIGGSKVVFLDEPTSGIDAISRRAIWEILDSVRSEDRTIVLTTHHLDEAEVLADRIGILAKGKLLAVGNNEFMKKNFGIGYTLSVYPDLNKKQQSQKEKQKDEESKLSQKEIILEDKKSTENEQFKVQKSDYQKIQFTPEQKQKIIDIITEKIPDAVLNPQSNMNSLIFMVSFQSQQYFVDLFEKLEKQEGFLINLEMNSLEDAFVNIGMDEDKFFKKENDLRKSLSQIQADVQAKVDAKYTYFDDIVPPECLSKPPVYRFRTQFTACYLRKFYCTIRNFTNYVSFFVPLFLMILGSGVMVNTPEQGPGKLVLLGIFFGIAYSFNGGIYIVQPVQEREENLKYAMNVMGCRVIPFWLGTFAFDFTVYMLTVIIFLLSARDNDYTYITDYEGKIFQIMFVFGFSFITFSYMCGFVLFSKSLSAMKGFPAINFFAVFILPWALLGVFYYLHYEQLVTGTTQLIMEKVLILVFFIYSPLYVLSQAFQYIQPPSTEYFELPFYSYSTNSNFYILVLLLQCVAYSTITYILEQKKYNLVPKDRNRFKKMKIHKIKDDNVVKEKERVIQNSKLEQYRLLDDHDKELLNDIEIQKSLQKLNEDKDKIVVRNLWKKYDSNNYVALKDVSYGVKKGEIMGLLGPNGAGKSTSFNILTALIPRSMGSVSIKDIQVNRGIMDIYQDVGICPQFDCVWSSLSPKEHLYLFGRMKGLTGKELEQAVKYFLEVTQLTDFVKTKAGNLSGGNKRKLCVANALIGGPDIQFFDEPSTGVDPIARRFLWNTLKQGAKLRNSAIVLTTHTMLEAESLCTKIGILINGQLQCLGTPQQLRNKYGDGYTFTVKVNSEEENEKFKQELQFVFPQMKEIPDKRDHYYAYQVGTNQFSFFEGYKLCEDMKKQNIILDFSINQCTLEQVFVRFSKFQEVNPQ